MHFDVKASSLFEFSDFTIKFIYNFFQRKRLEKLFKIFRIFLKN